MKTNVQEMINQVVEGKDPITVTRSVFEDNVSGGDRQDLTPEQVAAEFSKVANEMANSTPYCDKSYIDTVVTQIKSGVTLGDLQAMAAKNRGQYVDQGAKVDAEGSFDTWDVIHRAIQKVQTPVG